MTDGELLQKGSETVTKLVAANPDCSIELLMFKAYMGGLADGGNIVAGHVESFATIQKAKL